MRSIDWFEIGAVITGQAFADGALGRHGTADPNSGLTPFNSPLTIPDEDLETLLWQDKQEQSL